MDFEEFFKKKKIDLDALQKVEPALFSEFKTHYGAMGEKSFDHTKKYWFNKLRLQFPAPAEIKTEKVKIDNPLAEQTITESLSEQTVPAPKLGFVPKFKANIPKPTEPATENKTEQELTATPAPKLGFTPKFKAANVAKPIVEQPEETPTAEAPVTPPAPPKLGFTPKFKAANMPKPVADQPKETTPAEPPATPAPKLGFTPKFKAANMPKPAVKTEEPAPADTVEDPALTPPENTEAKPAYKPRFNMKNLPKKDEE